MRPCSPAGSLGFTSPRTAAVLAAAGLSGPAHTAGRLLVGGAAAPPRGGAPQQQPLQLGVGATAAAAAAAATPVSPGGSKKPRPELTLLIPNGGAAEPPAPAQQQQGAQGLQIHLSKARAPPPPRRGSHLRPVHWAERTMLKPCRAQESPGRHAARARAPCLRHPRVVSP